MHHNLLRSLSAISPHSQLVESLKAKHPVLGDYLNVASIENGEHPPSEASNPSNPFEAVPFPRFPHC